MRDVKKRSKAVAKRLLRRGKQIVYDFKTRPQKDPRTHYDIDVSVVIPVYNCEEYVAQTVRSISDHTKCRFEIITINDESPDDALVVLQELAKDIPQLKVLDQKNIGGANTLNRGLDLAEGKYVMCLDCDDWLAPGAIDLLFQEAEQHKAQVVGGSVQKFTDGVFEDLTDFNYLNDRLDVRIALGVPNDLLIDGFYTGKLFRKSHLDRFQIRFIRDMIYADRPFVTKAVCCARKVIMLPNYVAFWRKHLDGRSVTDDFKNPSNLIDKMMAFNALLRDPEIPSINSIRQDLLVEGARRLFWREGDAKDQEFAPYFALAARSLVAGYPKYGSIGGGKLSLRYKLLLDQAANYPKESFYDYFKALDAEIESNKHRSVAELAAAMRAVRHSGVKATEAQSYPVVKNANMFVFESFFGKNYGANPRYLYEELVRSGRKFTAVWVYSPQRKPFRMTAPPNVTLIQVARGSAQYHQLLREARYWVNNVRFPENIEKTPGTIYIQTWHGTPLKRLGLDIDASGPEVLARASFLKDASQWDYLLAQNDYSAEIFARAFDLKCPIIVEGYPANDVLSDAKKRNKANRYIRKKYNIPSEKKILTYAPTWRDKNQVGDQWKFANEIKINFKALQKAIGDEYVVVLRLHHLMVRSVSFSGLEGFLFDGSKEPDANRLMAATDLLVTDYSSIFFDYACSGKPMIFYMHDLEEYETEIRGFYFDPRSELPGPIVQDQSALVDAIKAVQENEAYYSGRYQAFAQKFLCNDKGRSSKAIAERIFSAERNSEDLKALNNLRRQESARTLEAKLAKDGAWSTCDYESEVSVAVPVTKWTEPTIAMLEALAGQIDIKIQTIAFGPIQPKKGVLSTADFIELPDTNLSGENLTTLLEKARGKFFIVVRPDAILQPDTFKVMFDQAERATANLLLKNTNGELDNGKVTTGKLIVSRWLTQPDLTALMVLTEFVRKTLGAFELSETALAAALLCRTRSCLTASVFPQSTETESRPFLDTTAAIAAMHAAQDLEKSAKTHLVDQSLRAQTVHKIEDLKALFAVSGLDPDTLDTLVRNACLAPELSDALTAAAVNERQKEVSGFILPYPVDQTLHLVFVGENGLTERSKQLIHFLQTQGDGNRIITNVGADALEQLSQPQSVAAMMTLSEGTHSFWYWLNRSGHVYCDGPLSNEVGEWFAQSTANRRVVQLATVSGSISDHLISSSLWTDIVSSSPGIDRDGTEPRAVRVSSRWAAIHQSEDTALDSKSYFRTANRIPKDEILVGVLNSNETSFASSMLIDDVYLSSLLPKSIWVVKETANAFNSDRIDEFMAACDILIASDIPIVARYKLTGRPFIDVQGDLGYEQRTHQDLAGLIKDAVAARAGGDTNAAISSQKLIYFYDIIPELTGVRVKHD